MSIALDVQPVRRPQRPVRYREDRYFDDRRPSNGSLDYGRARIAKPAGAHPLPVRRDRSDRPTMGVTLAAALLTAVVVMGILGLAHLRAPQHAPSVPMATSVVQVRGGESLSDVAARVAPDSPVGMVVDKIIELNDLAGAGVHPGRTLVTPSSSH